MSGFGLIKTTLIDYPGEVAATIFTPGCNLRCPFCHNPDFVSPPYPYDLPSMEEVVRFLEKRKNVLAGICISGGEPLVHPELETLIKKAKELGYLVKIDTNGTFPERLKELSKSEQLRPDFIAMDIKTSPARYERVGFTGSPDTIRESAEWIKQSGINHEFRTTVVPNIVNEEDFEDIRAVLRGATRYTITSFSPGATLDPDYSDTVPYDVSFLKRMKRYMTDASLPCRIRGVE